MNAKNRKLKNLTVLVVPIILVIVFITASLVHPQFLKISNIIAILQYISITGVLAIGITIVLIGGEIDISIASTAAFAASFGTFLTKYTSSNIIVIFGAIIFGAILGLANGLLIRYLKIPSFVLTLATYIVYRQCAIGINKGALLSIKQYAGWLWLGKARMFGIPSSIIILFVISLIAYFYLRFTISGKIIFYVGSNAKVSELSGINVKRNKVLIFVFSGILASIGGLMAAARVMQVDPRQIMAGYEMTAIAIAMLGGASLAGGRGTILGTIGAACIIGIVTNVQNLYSVTAYMQSVTVGIILILVIIVHAIFNFKRGYLG